MNLLSILQSVVPSVIPSVNPDQWATVWYSRGYTQDANYKRTPVYTQVSGIRAQIQPLSAGELRQLDGLNIQGVKRGIWLSGEIAGVIRATGQGGDIIQTGDNKIWLVVHVFEQWQYWAHCAVAEQNKFPEGINP